MQDTINACVHKNINSQIIDHQGSQRFILQSDYAQLVESRVLRGMTWSGASYRISISGCARLTTSRDVASSW